MLLLKKIMIEVVSLNYPQLCYNLKMHSQIFQLPSLNSDECSSAIAIDVSRKKRNKKKPKQSNQIEDKDTLNIGVHSLYHSIFTSFQCHNALSNNSDEKELIISLLMSRRLVRTSPTRSKNAEVSSWWKRSSKSNSSSFHSMIFEDNVGEDGLSAQSSYVTDINNSNYIDNLAPDPAMFDDEVLLGHDALNKVYTQLIMALNEV